MVLFVHRPEYYHIYDDGQGHDLRGMAQIIIAKHRKGATGDVLLTFRGEYTRFENPDERPLGNAAPPMGGGIIESRVNSEELPPFSGDSFRGFSDESSLQPTGGGPLPF
jgi:replicative DNA helicase